MNTLNFNDADLKANREGRLSDAQNKRLDAEADRVQKQSRYTLWICIVVFAFIAIVILINAYTTQPDQPQIESRWTTIVFAISAVVFIFVFLSVVFDYSRRTNSLVNDPIRIVEGKAEIITSIIKNRGRLDVNRLVIHRTWYSSVRFDFDDAASLHQFQHGHRYRVYYLHYVMPQALSAEEIEPEKAKR